MGAGKDLAIEQFRSHTANRIFGFNGDGEPALIGAFAGTNGVDANGSFGYVPAPVVADYYKFLSASGQWLSIAPGTTGTVPVSNGSGSFIDSGVVISAGSVMMYQKRGGGADIPWTIGGDADGGFLRYSVKDAPNRFVYKGVWLSTPAPTTSGNQDRLISNLGDWVVQIKITAIGMKNDASEGYSCTKIATFRRDGGIDPVQVGTTTTVSEHRDDNTENPTVTIAMAPSGGMVRVSYTAGAGSIDGYRWAVFYEITFLT